MLGAEVRANPQTLFLPSRCSLFGPGGGGAVKKTNNDNPVCKLLGVGAGVQAQRQDTNPDGGEGGPTVPKGKCWAEPGGAVCTARALGQLQLGV